MVSPRHYTVDPMLSASGTCLNAMERFYFIFLPVVLVSIVYFVCAPASEFGARPKGGGIASSSFFEKKKKIILGRNRTQGFNLLAKFSSASRGDSFTRQVSLWDRSLERGLRGRGIASSSFFEKKKKNHPRSESNLGFQSAREMFARFSRGFIHAPGIHPYGIEAMACMCVLNK